MLNEIKLIRIDERLIHSQIIFTWLKRNNINSIIIVDDAIAKDSFISHIYKLTTPPSIDMKILSEDDMIKYYNERCQIDNSKVRTLVIMKDFDVAVSLFKKGMDMNKILISDSYMEQHKKNTLCDRFKEALDFFRLYDVLVYYQNVVGGSIFKLN